MRTTTLTLILAHVCPVAPAFAAALGEPQAASPSDVERLVSRSRNAISIGHLRPARVLLEELLRQNPRRLDIALLLADVYHRQGHVRPALALLRRTAGIHAPDAPLQAGIARVSASDGQFRISQAAVGRLREIDPGDSWVRPLQGLLALAGKRPALAIAATEEAVPDPAAERFRIGARGAAVLLHVGTSLEDFLATPGVSAHRMDRFTQRYLRYVEGLAGIEEAVANLPAPFPAHPWVLKLRLGLSRVAGHEVDRRSILERLIESEPEQGDWSIAMAELDFTQQRFEACVARLRSGFVDRPMPYPAALLAGRALERTGDCELGSSLLEQYLATDPTNPEGNTALARCYVAQGRTADAEQRLLRALSAAPNFSPAVVALARLLREMGRDDEAMQLASEYRNLKRRSELRERALRSLRQAERALDAERWVEASGRAREAIGVDERLVPAHAIVATASLKLGDDAAARAAFERVVALEPGNAGARLELARLLASGGELAGAITLLEQTIAIPSADPAAVERARSELARLRAQERDE